MQLNQPSNNITISPYVYALGRIEVRYPDASVEKELAQAIGRAATVDLTDSQALQKVLQARQNRYLVRQLCWVLTVQGLETYVLVPRDPLDYELLVDALRSSPSATDLDVVIGARGPIASPGMCNGLLVPLLIFEQIYSFDRESLIKELPIPEGADAARFPAAAGEMFDRIIQQSDNAGAADEHRALNYLSVRYPAIYATAAAAFGRNASLTSIEVRPSPLSGINKIVNVVFNYTDRVSGVVEKYFVSVNVDSMHPYLVSKLAPYHDRF
jgi:hypothetical protein